MLPLPLAPPVLTQLAREAEALVGHATPEERARFFRGVLDTLARAEGHGRSAAAAATAEYGRALTSPGAAGEALAGMHNYLCQMLLVTFGHEGAASDFARTYLDARRWSALRPRFCLDLE